MRRNLACPDGIRIVDLTVTKISQAGFCLDDLGHRHRGKLLVWDDVGKRAAVIALIREAGDPVSIAELRPGGVDPSGGLGKLGSIFHYPKLRRHLPSQSPPLPTIQERPSSPSFATMKPTKPKFFPLKTLRWRTLMQQAIGPPDIFSWILASGPEFIS